MATNVKLDWGTQDEVIPNAATFTQYSVWLEQSGVVVTQAIEPIGTTTHTFLGVAPGDYVAFAVLEDPAGTDSAPPISAAFTVPPEATAPVVTTLTVTLQ